MIARLPITFLILSAALLRGNLPVAEQGADVGGRIRLWVWHYDSRLGAAAFPAYRDLLEAIPPQVPIVVGVRSAADEDSFRAGIGPAAARVRFLPVGRRVSGWPRDRYILFRRDGAPCVSVPPVQLVAPGWDGDLAVAHALTSYEPRLHLLESGLAIEGGNVLIAPEHVLIGFAAIPDNVELLQVDAGSVRRRIEAVFRRRLVVVADPESLLAGEHVDMYLSVVGRRRLLLGDPRRALGDLPAQGALGLHFSRATQEDFAEDYDRIAGALEREGFRVERIPILHAEEGTILTWNNAVLEARDGARYAYVPSYGLDALDDRAHDEWRAQGFQVVAVDVRDLIVLGGAVRCATNTLR